MKSVKIPSVGDVFGQWVVIGETKRVCVGKYWKYLTLCRCSCGKEKLVNKTFLYNGESKSCRHKNRVGKTCLHCGAAFSVIASRAKSAKYCSHKCSTDHNISGRYEKCHICAKGVWRTTVSESNKYFCSLECERIDRINRSKKKCNTCGELFNVIRSRKNAKFCSHKCYWESLRGKKYATPIYKQCLFCKKSFTVLKDEINRKYCCYECYWADKRKQARGARSSPEYKQWREMVFAFDNHECQKCGSKENLVAHHLKAYTTNPKLRTNIDNGVTLCFACHNRFHSEYTTIWFTEQDFFEWV